MKKLPTLGLFRKPKKEASEQISETAEPAVDPDPKGDHASGPLGECSTEAEDVIYLRAMPLREILDLDTIRNEVKNGKILILRITPLATKSIEDVKQAVGELYDFAEAIGGDIARLGEERVVICPPKVRIWREKAPVQNEPLPTAA